MFSSPFFQLALNLFILLFLPPLNSSSFYSLEVFYYFLLILRLSLSPSSFSLSHMFRVGSPYLVRPLPPLHGLPYPATSTPFLVLTFFSVSLPFFLAPDLPCSPSLARFNPQLHSSILDPLFLFFLLPNSSFYLLFLLPPELPRCPSLPGFNPRLTSFTYHLSCTFLSSSSPSIEFVPSLPPPLGTVPAYPLLVCGPRATTQTTPAACGTVNNVPFVRAAQSKLRRSCFTTKGFRR